MADVFCGYLVLLECSVPTKHVDHVGVVNCSSKGQPKEFCQVEGGFGKVIKYFSSCTDL